MVLRANLPPIRVNPCNPWSKLPARHSSLKPTLVYHSCNHRSCPQCGALDQQKWAATQEARLLPGVPYFLVTLTVPDALRGLCKLEPAILYDLLLRESAGALKDLCATKLGGAPGFTTVLHTWASMNSSGAGSPMSCRRGSCACATTGG